MDIETIKRISEAKIKAGNIVNSVRNTLKEYEHVKQDTQEDLLEVYKPIVQSQEAVKKSIDEQQDKILEQLQNNQRALTSGLEDLLMQQQLSDKIPEKTAPLPLDYKPKMMKPEFKSDLDSGFDID